LLCNYAEFIVITKVTTCKNETVRVHFKKNAGLFEPKFG